MSNSKKLNSATAFIEYKPAELHKNKDWRIVYYAKIPAKNELKKKMVLSINEKLSRGWSPFYEDKTNKYKSIDDAFLTFLSITEREVQDGIKRKDTLRSYTSQIKNFDNYLKTKRKDLKFLLELDIYVVNAFLDHIYMIRKVSATTYNNYLRFLVSFFEFCISKGYITQNPTQGIKKKPQQKKKREVLSQNEKQKLQKYGKENKAYYTLCMLTYYCFIRRTELTKIKVSEVNLKNAYITILGENAKNRKTENVTIPKALYPLLIKHLKTAKNDDFLFSKNGFKAGKIQLTQKKYLMNG